MDANSVKPFVEAILHILSSTASTNLKAKKPYLKKDQVARGAISALIELSGDINGSVAISFSEPCILGIVSNMFGENMTELNAEIKDAVGEFTNMLCGQVTNKFAEMGKTFKAKASPILMDKNHKINHSLTQPVIAMPYCTDKGELTIEICFDEKK